MLSCFKEDYASDGSFDFAAAQTPRANGHTNGVAVFHHMHVLGVGSPGTAGLAIGVADVVAMHDTLAAYFTIFTHTYTSLWSRYV